MLINTVAGKPRLLGNAPVRASNSPTTTDNTTRPDNHFPDTPQTHYKIVSAPKCRTPTGRRLASRPPDANQPHRPAATAAPCNTSASIAGVSRPVKVFC
ncbi:MAG: hypothetical protein QOE71_1658 [Pseudonocardiales bacterium]|nr:hypothetical protein [Pseudonocardiales bacterium]